MIFVCLRIFYYKLIGETSEFKIIERINSNETFITYLSDNDE